jgi:glycosyltransferase involved in cell wall biosynthesis
MIVHVFNPSVISGPETLVIPELVKLGKRFKVLFLREARVAPEKNRSVESYLNSMGVEWEAIDVKERVDRHAIELLANRLTVLDCEIAHAHDVKASTYLLKAARQILNRRFSIVTTHHGISARPGLKLRLYELYYCFAIASRYDRVLAVCTADYNRLLKRGLSKKRVRLHLNGVTRPKIDPAARLAVQATIRERWNTLHKQTEIRKSSLVLGVVARLAEGKRHDLIIKVAHRMRELAPDLDFKILIFGSGPLESDLKAQVEAIELNDEILFMGYDSHVGGEMAGFDALLSLSSAEGLPINLIEAGWAATPAFASGVDGVLDLISTGDVGRVLDKNASIEETATSLLSFSIDKKYLQEAGQNFQTRVVLNFSGQAWFDRLDEIYTELRQKKTKFQPRKTPTTLDCEVR